jgi:hypothetical protein
MKIKGHCLITDGKTTILDQTNDIHPGNMSQIISRALANDSNYWINSIAFGDGGCDYIQEEHIPRPPNDGLLYSTWDDKLNNEIHRIYLEQIDIEYDGGYDNTKNNLRPLEDYDASPHPYLSRFNRNKQGIVSYLEDGVVKVEILCQLKHNYAGILSGGVFTFSEIGLFSGYTLPKISTRQEIEYKLNISGNTSFSARFNGYTKTFYFDSFNLISKLNELVKYFRTTVTQETALSLSSQIDFNEINLNNILFKFGFDPVSYDNKYEIVAKTKTDNISSLIVELSKYTNITIASKKLIISSGTDFEISQQPGDLFDKLFAYIYPPVVTVVENQYEAESTRTDKNNPMHPEHEASRLLTHLTFEPIDCPAMSNYYLIYTLTIDVEPTAYQDHEDFMVPDEYRVSGVYEYNTVYELTEWVIFHQLGYVPDTIQIFVDNRLFSDYRISYGDRFNTENSATNQLTVIFKEPTKGTARLI